MSIKYDPIISTTKEKPYTKITFKPDLKIFKMDILGEDM
jgi:DNA gyrase/topoisomerase IV subunit B